METTATRMLIENEIPVLPPPNRAALEEQGMSLRDWVDLLAEGRGTLFRATASFLGLAGLYLLFTPPTYKADALLRIDKNKALLAAPLRSEANRAPAEAENPRAQREVEIMRSRSVLGKVVSGLNLQVEAEPRYFPLIGETLARWRDDRAGPSEPWPGFRRWAFGGENIEVAEFSVPERFLGKEFTLIALGQGRFQLLDPDGATAAEGQAGTQAEADLGEKEPLVLRVQALEAHAGTHFTLVRRSHLSAIEALNKAISVKEASKDTDILKVELKGRDPASLAKSVNDISTTYVHATVAWESAEAGQKLAFLESQLPVIKERLEHAEQALSAFRQQHGAVDISTEAEVLLKQAAEMETLGIKLKQQFEEQNQKLEGAHPEMIATKAQIKRIDRKLADLERRIKELPRTQQNMVGLARDVQVNTELYTSLLNSAQEQRVASAGSIGNSRIVDFAVAPEQPHWPKPGLVLALAGLLGLTTGSGAVFLRNSLRRHDNYPALLEYRIGIPLFAAIPHSRKQVRLARLAEQGKGESPKVLASEHPQDISVESLRSLRTTVEATLASSESRVLMVSSPAPGMGKSFVSANLAALLASIRKRVLIIDADMRNGQLDEMFSTRRTPGLSDLLAGNATLGEVVVSLPGIGIDFIPRGSEVANPAELLVLGQMEETLEILKSFYNHIVFDSPPILGATDAAIIGKQADATFLVVKEGRYTVQELEVSFRRFQLVGVKPRGFIINDMKEGSSAYPYYAQAYPQARH